MVLVPVTVLGGLPVLAEVTFSGSGDDFETEINKVYWRAKGRRRGLEVSSKIFNRIMNYDDGDSITEQANEWVGENCQTWQYSYDPQCWKSDEYRRYNP